MPLARAKDSFLNLRELQQAQWEKRRESGAEQSAAAAAATSTDGSRNALEWLEPDDVDEATTSSSTTSSCYWDPPKDPRDFEQILPLEEPSKRFRFIIKCCSWLPSWCPSWQPLFKSLSSSPQDNTNSDASTTISDSWNFESDNSIGILQSSTDAKNSRMHDSTKNGGGIVRRASLAMQLTLGLPTAKRKSYHPMTYNPRSSRDVSTLHVHFAPQKRIVPIRPLSSMSDVEKERMWWQYDDYDAFQIETLLLIREEEADKELSAVWLAGMKGKADGTLPTQADDDDNWWHKYQHSRRGLERYVSREEAVEIQRSYKTALNVVLKEQWRQRNWLRHDPEKLARLYHEYTVWSRDLALAAGASDADAVKCDFDDSKRKSREYFLLKQLLQSGEQHKHVPSFMLPSPAPTKVKKYLDG